MHLLYLNLKKKKQWLSLILFLNFTDLVIDINNNDCDRLKRIDGISEELVESIKRNRVFFS